MLPGEYSDGAYESPESGGVHYEQPLSDDRQSAALDGDLPVTDAPRPAAIPGLGISPQESGPTGVVSSDSLSSRVHIASDQPEFVFTEKPPETEPQEPRFVPKISDLPGLVLGEKSPEAEPDDGSVAESGKSRGGEEDFGVKEALSDLDEAQGDVALNLRDLDGRRDGEKAVVAEARDETAALNRLITAAQELLAKGQPVPPGLAISITIRVELVQEAVKQAADRADGELKVVLEGILKRTRRVGRKLLSMNLHLFPVKEWSLGGEVSAGFVKGSISVTFGR